MDKVEVAQGVAARLFATEAALDEALAEASMLVAQMTRARRTLGISTESGDAAVSKVSDVIAGLAAARKTISDAHGELLDTKLRLGIRTKLVGQPDKPPQVAPANVAEFRRVG